MVMLDADDNHIVCTYMNDFVHSTPCFSNVKPRGPLTLETKKVLWLLVSLKISRMRTSYFELLISLLCGNKTIVLVFCIDSSTHWQVTIRSRVSIEQSSDCVVSLFNKQSDRGFVEYLRRALLPIYLFWETCSGQMNGHHLDMSCNWLNPSTTSR